MGDWMHFVVDKNNLKERERLVKWYAINKNTYPLEIDKTELCKFFNETPQRIRKGLDLLYRLNLINYQDKNHICLNNNLIGEILEREVVEAKSDLEEERDSQLELNRSIEKTILQKGV